MLSSPQRLRQDAQIRRLIRTGRSQYGTYVSIRWAPNERAVSRFCFVVANKVSKKANRRNLLRRRLSEIVRLHWAEITPGVDVVVFVQAGKGALETDYQQLEQDLLSVLRRQKLYQTPA